MTSPEQPAVSAVRTEDLSSTRSLGWPSLGLLMVASVGSIAQLSDSASFGLGAVVVYLVPALLFLLPVGLVSAELATSHPGGIFVWMREAFGPRVGFQATWFSFMNSVTLYPSLLSFGAAALAASIGRADLAENGIYMGAVVLTVFWIATATVSRGMRYSTTASNVGLIVGTIIPALVLILFLSIWLIESRPSQIEFAVSDVVPPFDGLSSIALVVGTFVAFAGLEVNAVHIGHLKGRPRNYLRSVLLAVAIVFFMYLLGSLAISVVVPDSSLELTSGASQAFTVYTNGFDLPGFGNVLSSLLVVGAFAASIAWIGGPSRSMWLVGRHGFLPPRLQRTNQNGIQMPLLKLQGTIVTVLALVFVVAPSTSQAFAVLQDVSITLYMLMYLCMFAGAIRLRRSDPDCDRPIRVPGLPIIAVVGMVSAVAAIVLSMTPPAGFSTASTPLYASIVGGCVILLSLPPLVIHRYRRPSWMPEPPLAHRHHQP